VICASIKQKARFSLSCWEHSLINWLSTDWWSFLCWPQRWETKKGCSKRICIPFRSLTLSNDQTDLGVDKRWRRSIDFAAQKLVVRSPLVRSFTPYSFLPFLLSLNDKHNIWRPLLVLKVLPPRAFQLKEGDKSDTDVSLVLSHNLQALSELLFERFVNLASLLPSLAHTHDQDIEQIRIRWSEKAGSGSSGSRTDLLLQGL